MANMTQEMRNYLDTQLPLPEMRSLARGMGTQALQNMIGSFYEGGFEQWRIDYMGTPSQPMNDKTELQLRKIVTEDLGFRLQQSDRVVSLNGWTHGDLECLLTIESVITTADLGRTYSEGTTTTGIPKLIVGDATFGREREVSRRLRVYHNSTGTYMTRGHLRGESHGEWSLLMDVEDPEFVGTEYAGQYAVLNTPERFAQKIFSYLDCARPGSGGVELDAPGSESRVSSDWEALSTLARLAPEQAAKYYSGEYDV